MSFFWLFLFGVFYAYFGYPISLILLKVIRRQQVRRDFQELPVTLLITAFNEEKRIREKLENSLALEYKKDKFQILVASDGSTDATNEIVASYADQGVELLEVANRGGKENAQKEAVEHA